MECVCSIFAYVVLILGALAFCAFGVQWLDRPEAMARPLGILLTNADATSDARAVYGGMELGFGLFLAYSAQAVHRRPQGLVAAALTLFGLGASRLTGIAVASGAVSGSTYQLLATDLAGALLCTVAFFVTRARGGESR